MTARSFYATGQLAIFPQYLCYRCAPSSAGLPPLPHAARLTSLDRFTDAL